MEYGLHIIKNPAGTFSFVGSVPSILGCEVPASKADVMAGRAYKRKPEGLLVTIKFPVFTTEQQARDYAKEKGASVS